MTRREDKLRGRPPKQGRRFAHALFVRADSALLDGLDKLVERERKARPGRSCSRGDLVREILGAAVRAGA